MLISIITKSNMISITFMKVVKASSMMSIIHKKSHHNTTL